MQIPVVGGLPGVKSVLVDDDDNVDDNGATAVWGLKSVRWKLEGLQSIIHLSGKPYFWVRGKSRVVREFYA